MNFPLAIFTEASVKIGTGHLMESFNLAKIALRQRIGVRLWINNGVPRALLARSPCAYRLFASPAHRQAEAIRGLLSRDKCRIAVFNFRQADNKFISALKYNGLKIACIDELGNSPLDCDCLVNPLIAKRGRDYFSLNHELKIYAGPQYLCLSPELAGLRRKKRPFQDKIRAISICMGGVDRSRATFKIMSALAEFDPLVVKNVILGGGFLYLKEAYQRIKALKNRGFKAYYNLKNVASLFMASDIAFTAGGNTLYELACLGTPAIVLYEDEHEKENGLAFQRLGFGYCLKQGTEAKKEDILQAVKKFADIKNRIRHSARGKKIVDGQGCQRTLHIVKGLLSDDSAI